MKVHGKNNQKIISLLNSKEKQYEQNKANSVVRLWIKMHKNIIATKQENIVFMGN